MEHEEDVISSKLQRSSSRREPLFDKTNQIELNTETYSDETLPSLTHIKSSEEITTEIEFMNGEISSQFDELMSKMQSLMSELSNLQPKEIESISQKTINADTIKQPLNSLPFTLTESVDLENIFSSIKSESIIPNVNYLRDLELGCHLGSGKFSDVLLCRHKITGAIFALKKILMSCIDQYNMSDQIFAELIALKRVNFEGVVKVITAFTDEFHLFILMELAHGPSLISCIPMNESSIQNILRQLINSLLALHNLGIVHRDVKPENIIYEFETKKITLCDLGWASVDSPIMTTRCGTFDYLSYEMVQELPYTSKVDMWNVGVLAYELLHGFPPFKNSSCQTTLEKIANLDFSFQIDSSETYKDFVLKLLVPESIRLSVYEALSHPFLTC